MSNTANALTESNLLPRNLPPPVETEGKAAPQNSIDSQLRKKKLLTKIAAVVGATLVGIYICQTIYHSLTYVTTDDAHVAAFTSTLSSRVGGTVIDIPVAHNQNVSAGDVLVRIEPSDYQNRVAQVQAEIGSLEAKLKDAERNYHRAKRLLVSDSISAQQADTAEAGYRELTQKLASLNAQFAQANLDLQRTTIIAPTDGKVGKRSIEKGVVVAPGQALIAFVQAHERWIEANFKETQIRNMVVGQKVEVDVDAISGRSFDGHVESFAPGSGATFSVLPPDNATGNFVKIVQRVPVRIALDAESIKGYEDRLLPGLSANVTVRIR